LKFILSQETGSILQGLKPDKIRVS
jgi:hypothetical protein